mmetsp:Transcript_4674/g.19895  ORF Transcript_4674/g.19895 Transcript_4674/m.19895 type:complete len:266 (-) Transcript_4674:561-1358(-)
MACSAPSWPPRRSAATTRASPPSSGSTRARGERWTSESIYGRLLSKGATMKRVLLAPLTNLLEQVHGTPLSSGDARVLVHVRGEHPRVCARKRRRYGRRDNFFIGAERFRRPSDGVAETRDCLLHDQTRRIGDGLRGGARVYVHAQHAHGHGRRDVLRYRVHHFARIEACLHGARLRSSRRRERKLRENKGARVYQRRRNFQNRARDEYRRRRSADAFNVVPNSVRVVFRVLFHRDGLREAPRGDPRRRVDDAQRGERLERVRVD